MGVKITKLSFLSINFGKPCINLSKNNKAFDCSHIEVCIKNSGGPLGIHVVPDYDHHGRYWLYLDSFFHCMKIG